MSTFAEFVLNGIFLGVLYSLVAIPLTSIWTTTDVIDINIGGYATVAGIIAATLGGIVGIILGVFAAAAMGVITGALFYLFHKISVIKDPITIVLATFGLLFATTSAVQAAVGTDSHFVPGLTSIFLVSGTHISAQGILNLSIATALFIVLAVTMRYTLIGLKMRAAALSTQSAELIGVPVRTVQITAFIAGAAIAGAAGILAAISVGISYASATQFTIFAFTAAIICGLKGPTTAFCGGLLLGVIDSLSAGYLPSGWSALVPPLIIFAVLASGRAGLSVSKARA